MMFFSLMEYFFCSFVPEAVSQEIERTKLTESKRQQCQTNGVMLNSRTETVLPKHGPTDGADSMPE